MTEGATVDELARQCGDETARYARGAPFSERPCLELFRRAIAGRDDAAWAALFAQYGSLVRRWAGPPTEDAEDRVLAAFERFWHALDAAKLARFGSLAAILQYLRLCVHTTRLDRARAARANVATMPLVEAATVAAQDDVESAAAAHLDGASVWQAVRAVVTDQAEREVLYCSYVLDLTPRQIQARRPTEFASVLEVYRLKRAALDRLRRDPRLRSLL